MKHHFFYPLAASFLFFACASVDVEKSVRLKSGAGKTGSAPEALIVPVEMPREVVTVEKPVYVPEKEKPAASGAPKGYDAARASNAAGIMQPSEYSFSAMVYDFNADWVYEVYCQPLRVTDIRLEAGETAVEAPYVADSERWMLGAGVSYENGLSVQHVYVKPVAPALEATLIINTDKRSYHIILRSYQSTHMPMVRWRYARTRMPNNYAASTGAFPGNAGREADAEGGVDPRFLSFNYRVTYALFKKPSWLPSLAYDDGKKTYIIFPEDVLMKELPAVFENRNDIVNFRVIRNIVVIDKLIEKITVKIENRQIVIEKKRGKS
jgi:type IV secretion system protein VirB9